LRDEEEKLLVNAWYDMVGALVSLVAMMSVLICVYFVLFIQIINIGPASFLKGRIHCFSMQVVIVANVNKIVYLTETTERTSKTHAS